MAAPLKHNRIAADRVRTLGLAMIEKILADDYPDKAFQKEVLLKLTPTLLPRLTEVSGEDGEALQIIIKRHDEGNTTISPAGQGDIQPAKV